MIRIYNKHIILLLVLTGWLLCDGCDKDTSAEQKPTTDRSPTPYHLDIPLYFPTKLNIPVDNPMTVEGVELGRHLFYEGRLSGRSHPDSLMTCASCHLQKNGFECGLDHPGFTNGRPHGLTGIPTTHTMLPLVNLVWNFEGYLWNGLVAAAEGQNIESVVSMAIVAPDEINGSVEKTVRMIASVDLYRPLFKAAFGTEEVTIDRISKAVAQFVRTLVSANSRFDQYLRGEVHLTTAERQGYVLFTTEEGADCFHCHGAAGTPLWTSNQFYNNGKDASPTDPYDRFSVTGKPSDQGAYKAPTLRNIAVTAPYMHDGRFRSLDEVLGFYNTGLNQASNFNPLLHKISQGGMQLPQSELDNLKAFLHTLTDTAFLTNPSLANPRPGDPFFVN